MNSNTETVRKLKRARIAVLLGDISLGVVFFVNNVLVLPPFVGCFLFWIAAFQLKNLSKHFSIAYKVICVATAISCFASVAPNYTSPFLYALYLVGLVTLLALIAVYLIYFYLGAYSLFLEKAPDYARCVSRCGKWLALAVMIFSLTLFATFSSVLSFLCTAVAAIKAGVAVCTDIYILFILPKRSGLFELYGQDDDKNKDN